MSQQSDGQVKGVAADADDAFEAEMGAISRVYSLRAGHTLTADDFDAIQLYEEVSRRDQQRTVDAFHDGYMQGLREGGSTDIEQMQKRLDDSSIKYFSEYAMRQFADRRVRELLELLDDLNCSDILGVAESCASGTPRWETVHKRIERARAAIAKAKGDS